MSSFILASGSSVRQHLLKQAGAQFTIDPADIDEFVMGDVFARAAALAVDKAQAIARKHAGAWVVGADQVGAVVDEAGRTLEGELQKCWSEDEALVQLMSMSGKTHRFVSAAALARHDEARGMRVYGVVEESAFVSFRRFSMDEARRYLALGEWKGCAGSYQLDGKGIGLVEKVEGSAFAVYGLPLIPLLRLLRSYQLVGI